MAVVHYKSPRTLMMNETQSAFRMTNADGKGMSFRQYPWYKWCSYKYTNTLMLEWGKYFSEYHNPDQFTDSFAYPIEDGSGLIDGLAHERLGVGVGFPILYYVANHPSIITGGVRISFDERVAALGKKLNVTFNIERNDSGDENDWYAIAPGKDNEIAPGKDNENVIVPFGDRYIAICTTGHLDRGEDKPGGEDKPDDLILGVLFEVARIDGEGFGEKIANLMNNQYYRDESLAGAVVYEEGSEGFVARKIEKSPISTTIWLPGKVHQYLFLDELGIQVVSSVRQYPLPCGIARPELDYILGDEILSENIPITTTKNSGYVMVDMKEN